MKDELSRALSETVNCLNDSEEEKAACVLLMALKNYPDADVWNKQIGMLIGLKKQIEDTPAANRKIIHSLLEQILMLCIDRGFNSGELNINDLRQILELAPDNSVLITVQEALEYKFGQLALMAMRALNQNQQWELALFFLEQARKRNTPLRSEDYLSMSETFRNNQQPSAAVSYYKKALMQI
ncbi:MAG: hypothetical protein J5809_09020 [Selenomonadaceae bacterium]|nr:hypothetical protein [Selenomonadaceae bacterium]